MSWLREQCSLLGEFMRSDFRRYLFWCAIGLTAAFALGLGAAAVRPDLAETTLDAFAQQVEQAGVLDGEGGMSVFALLMNNWRAMLISALYGLIPFLFLPLVSLLTNGVLIGVMFGIYQANGMSLAALLAGLIPHGVFELPALIFSIACGVRLCRNMCLLVINNPQKAPFMALAEDLLRVLVLVIAPLTIHVAVYTVRALPLLAASTRPTPNKSPLFV